MASASASNETDKRREYIKRTERITPDKVCKRIDISDKDCLVIIYSHAAISEFTMTIPPNTAIYDPYIPGMSTGSGLDALMNHYGPHIANQIQEGIRKGETNHTIERRLNTVFSEYERSDLVANSAFLDFIAANAGIGVKQAGDLYPDLTLEFSDSTIFSGILIYIANDKGVYDTPPIILNLDGILNYKNPIGIVDAGTFSYFRSHKKSMFLLDFIQFMNDYIFTGIPHNVLYIPQNCRKYDKHVPRYSTRIAHKQIFKNIGEDPNKYLSADDIKGQKDKTDGVFDTIKGFNSRTIELLYLLFIDRRFDLYMKPPFSAEWNRIITRSAGKYLPHLLCGRRRRSRRRRTHHLRKKGHKRKTLKKKK